MFNGVGRRLGVAVAAAFVAMTAAFVAAPNVAFAAEGTTAVAASGGYGGSVSRETVIARAKDWYDRNVPYSENTDPSTWVWDVNHGKKYRADCSGFVSMTWKLTTSRTTETLDGVSHTINWNDLLPGDILLTQGHHVQLFAKWANSDTKADFYIYEEGNTKSDMNYREVNVVTERNGKNPDGNKYVPYRYDNIVK